MRPVVTDGVAWSICWSLGLSVSLSVCHDHETICLSEKSQAQLGLVGLVLLLFLGISVGLSTVSIIALRLNVELQ